VKGKGKGKGKGAFPTHQPRSTPQKQYFSASGTHSYQRLSKLQGLVRLEGLDKLKKLIHLIGSRTREKQKVVLKETNIHRI
jgi:hypothetical protein